MKVLVLGSSGMLGAAMASQLNKNPDVQVLTTSRGQDNPNFVISDVSEIKDLIKTKRPEVVINCIGVIKPRINSNDTQSIAKAISVNALFPHELFKWTQEFGSRLIQIATDCVFDGRTGGYSETDAHCPTDVYGMTKSLGELPNSSALNLRCSIIGPSPYNNDSLYEWVINSPKNSKLSGFSNHTWNGVTTLVFAQIVERAITMNNPISGTYHVVPGDSVTKFQLLTHIAALSGRSDLIILEKDAETTINRKLVTNHQDINRMLWGVETNSQIPKVLELPILY
jgi:dTDP-4-dehydrorhamnose reductase